MQCNAKYNDHFPSILVKMWRRKHTTADANDIRDGNTNKPKVECSNPESLSLERHLI